VKTENACSDYASNDKMIYLLLQLTEKLRVRVPNVAH